MEAKAIAKTVRISALKSRLVMRLRNGKDVSEAMAILKLTPKAAAEIVEKLLSSAIANAENNHSMDTSKLVVSKCFVTPGRIAKRIQARDKGRAYRILKRSSHITIAVKEKE